METIECAGYQWAGVASGLKKNKAKDLGLIYSEVPAAAAAIFTRNQIQAAPVKLDKKRIQAGVCQAVIVNSGNANCCTGERGMQDAVRMTQLAASGLGISDDLVLVASTGVIGQPLAMDKVEKAVPSLVESLHSIHMTDFAEAIMTTDTVPKTIARQAELDGAPYTVVGTAKGSGMIRPDMATMLCFLMTDATATAGQLREMLTAAADKSLNRITIDGDTSTNDTAILMANGLSAATLSGDGRMTAFQSVLDDVLLTLSRQLVEDGEGATKVVEISVQGALTTEDANRVADTLAHSNLLKTAFFGEDANWGRIFAAVGRSGANINPDTIHVYFDDVMRVKDSIGCGDSAEKKATQIMKKPEFKVTVDLKMGSGQASMLTCDFSTDYVRINADYRS
jgi:glutamate N-acetyltransferase/amino-acid N-acetyltransferase